MSINETDLKYVVQSISNEKGLPEDVIFAAIEEALAAVAARRFTDEVKMRVTIDTKTCEQATFRCWEIIADTEEALEFPGYQLTLSQAQESYPDSELQVGEEVEEEIETEKFGRIDSQQARQVIFAKVREAERAKIAQDYQDSIGEMLMGVVKRVTREYLVIDMGSNAEAILYRDEMIPRESFRMNDRVRVYLREVQTERRGPQLIVSRTDKEFLRELFKIEVPEIGEEVIDIRAVARDPGFRAKIAVRTNDGRIDPIGACVGMRGSRVQAVSNELAGERIDIVLWHDDPAQLAINAMSPAEVASIVVDEDKHSMDVAVKEENLAQAIGRNGQNVRMVSELIGWTLNVMSEEAALEKHQSEANQAKEKLMEVLGIEEAQAASLAAEGFSGLQDVAYASVVELQKILGIDMEATTELHTTANDLLFIEKMTQESAAQPSDELLALEGVTSEIAEALATAKILTLDDLADQSIDELQEIVELDDEAAGKLIMKAREHWFADD